MINYGDFREKPLAVDVFPSLSLHISMAVETLKANDDNAFA